MLGLMLATVGDTTYTRIRFDSTPAPAGTEPEILGEEGENLTGESGENILGM